MSEIKKKILFGKEFRAIPGYEEYWASADGEIASTKKSDPIIMKPISTTDGHMYVFLYSDGNMKKMWIHRAVLLSWDRLPEEFEECRHLNDVPSDNRLENLCWGTRAENVNDKRANNGLPVGEKSGTCKLTEKQVLEIRKEYGKTSLRKLGEKYGVSHTAIRRAALGIKWSYLSKEEKNA